MIVAARKAAIITPTYPKLIRSMAHTYQNVGKDSVNLSESPTHACYEIDAFCLITIEDIVFPMQVVIELQVAR